MEAACYESRCERSSASRFGELIEVALHTLEDEVELVGFRGDEGVVEGNYGGVLRYAAERLRPKRGINILRAIWLLQLTTSSPNVLACFHPPSHIRFILFSATNLLPAHSGRAPAPHCIAERRVPDRTGECQSQSQTVPKEPSPRHFSSL